MLIVYSNSFIIAFAVDDPKVVDSNSNCNLVCLRCR